jgi:hypothetical protein
LPNFSLTPAASAPLLDPRIVARLHEMRAAFAGCHTNLPMTAKRRVLQR